MLVKLVFGLIWLAMVVQGLWRRQLREVLWTWWPIVMLIVPVWMIWMVRTIRLDARSIVAVGFLSLLVLRPFQPRWPRIILTDYVIGLLLISMCITQQLSGDLKLTVPLELIRFWLLPYIVGRLFFNASEQIDACLPWMLRVLAVACVMAIFESIVKVNVVNKIFGISFYHLEMSEGYRWGLKRAQGPAEHPLGLGMLLLLFLPWALEGFRRAGKHGFPFWWKFVPVLVLGAAIGTVSRSAMIGFVMIVGVYLFFQLPRWRLTMAIAASVVVGLFVSYQQEVIDLLASAEKHRQHQVMVRVNGRDVEYSGVRHRQLLNEVYGPALDQAGAFGYGPYLQRDRVPRHPDTDSRFESIDDHYIFYTLQYGYAGKALFLGLLSIAVIYLMLIAWSPNAPGAGLAAGLCGSLVVVSLLLKSVFFSPDFAPMWLFNIGLAACLYQIGRRERVPYREPSMTEPVGPLRNLDRQQVGRSLPREQAESRSDRPLPLRSFPPRTP